MKIIIFLLLVIVSLSAQGQKILPANKGITLAQAMINNSRHSLLVLADNNSVISAIDLSTRYKTNADMISVYHAIGYDRLVELSTKNNVKTISLPIDKLLSPAGSDSHHVAAGLNYGKHADEVDSKHVPFLFVKATKATRQQNISVNPQELLDYEVELCARPLTTMTQLPSKKEPAFGFFLCGDFTDRAELLRGMDIDNMQSGRGFSTAKSKSGYFPTGPYMVISKSWQKMIANTELSLTLNGELKQKASAKKMIWPLSTILEKAWLHDKNNTPVYTNKAASLLPNREISSNMVILTGTPEGVMFKPPALGFKIWTALKFIISGEFTDNKLTDYVVEHYAQAKLQEKALLQPGDQLTLRASYLGQLNLIISEENNKQTKSKQK